MIKTIRIQNFRSLQDVTLDLQDVNLLIGPNNSGKTNLMKALRFLGEFLSGKIPIQNDPLQNYFYLRKITEDSNKIKPPIIFTLTKENEVYRFELFGCVEGKAFILRQFNGLLNSNYSQKDVYNIDFNKIESITDYFDELILQVKEAKFFARFLLNPLFKDVKEAIKQNVQSLTLWKDKDGEKSLSRTSEFDESDFMALFGGFEGLSEAVIKTGIYSVIISNLKQPYPTLEDDYSVKPDASNLVAFLDNMRDNKPQIMSAINANLKECIKEFESITFEKVKLPKDHDLRKIHGDKTFKRLGVQDKFNQIYWADELSDGTLYFLALLAIIHQPDPPKLLMVEEPENGIHPRRIKEIIDYFFTIAEEKGIQVILTTHSTVVIDQFKDLPESIFVFDKKDQATQVRNLATDIIAEDKILSEEKHVPALDLSGSLGDHWAAGLIGGVPR